MSVMASQITVVSIVYSTVGSGADQGKHQSSASLTFEMGVHRRPVNSPHKKNPFDDVILYTKIGIFLIYRIFWFIELLLPKPFPVYQHLF